MPSLAPSTQATATAAVRENQREEERIREEGPLNGSAPGLPPIGSHTRLSDSCTATLLSGYSRETCGSWYTVS